MEGGGIELLVPVLNASQDRQAFDGAIVEDFDEVRRLAGEPQIGFVQNERAAECIQCMEDRRDRRSARREKTSVDDRPNGDEGAGLAAAIVASEAQVGAR